MLCLSPKAHPPPPGETSLQSLASQYRTAAADHEIKRQVNEPSYWSDAATQKVWFRSAINPVVLAGFQDPPNDTP